MADEIERVVRQADRQYFGKYRGFVVDNDDPEQLGRLRLRIPSILGDVETDWALPCLPYGGLADQGWFAVPEIGAQVWIEFEQGVLSAPIWVGTFWQVGGDTPQEAQLSPPTTRVMKTTSGHVLEFADQDGSEKVRLYHKADAYLVIDENGTVDVQAADGARLTLDAKAGKVTLEDANGHKVEMESSKITISDQGGSKIEMQGPQIKVEAQVITVQGTQIALGGSGGEFLVKGMSMMTLFNTHTHIGAAPGAPTSPPVVPMTPAQLSTKVTTS
jgi:phage baseplate assembly protein gpV